MGRMNNLYPLVGSVAGIEEKPVERLTTYKLNAFVCHEEKKCKTERTNMVSSNWLRIWRSTHLSGDYSGSRESKSLESRVLECRPRIYGVLLGRLFWVQSLGSTVLRSTVSIYGFRIWRFTHQSGGLVWGSYLWGKQSGGLESPIMDFETEDPLTCSGSTLGRYSLGF